MARSRASCCDCEVLTQAKHGSLVKSTDSSSNRVHDMNIAPTSGPQTFGSAKVTECDVKCRKELLKNAAMTEVRLGCLESAHRPSLWKSRLESSTVLKRRKRRAGVMVNYQRLLSALLIATALLLVFLAGKANGQISTDDRRCFLANGGSSQTLLVHEGASVNAEIGAVGVIGEPERDINLRLLTNGNGNNGVGNSVSSSAVEIVPGTKILRLVSQLDKEERDGPSKVDLRVECSRMGSQDAPLVIPIYIKVLDDNDRAPYFVGAPYSVNVSEMTAVGSTILEVMAKDEDQDGPFSTIQYSIVPDIYSDYVSFASNLNGKIILRKALDFETMSQFSVTLRAQDQGKPPLFGETSLTIHIQDGDDRNPAFLEESYYGVVPEPPLRGTRVPVGPRQIMAYDQDTGLGVPVTFSLVPNGEDSEYFTIDPREGSLYIYQDVPDEALFTPFTLVVKATQVDNKDRSALATVSMVREGSFPERLKFAEPNYRADILESAPVNSIVLRLNVNRQDKRMVFHLDVCANNDGPKQPRPTEAGEVFNFALTSPAGELVLVRPLDYEQRQSYCFIATATDGRNNATAELFVRVLDVNDHGPKFGAPEYVFPVSTRRVKPGLKVGAVQVTDGDVADRISLSLKGPHARSFSVTKDGSIYLKELRGLNVSNAHFIVMAQDSGQPPRQSSVPVQVVFPEELVSAWGGSEGSGMLLIILGILLGLLFFVIIGLIFYISRHKRVGSTGSEASLTGSSPPPPAALFGSTTALHHSTKNGVKSAYLSSSSPPGLDSTDSLVASMHRNLMFSNGRQLKTSPPLGTTSRNGTVNGLTHGNLRRSHHQLQHTNEFQNASIQTSPLRRNQQQFRSARLTPSMVRNGLTNPLARGEEVDVLYKERSSAHLSPMHSAPSSSHQQQFLAQPPPPPNPTPKKKPPAPAPPVPRQLSTPVMTSSTSEGASEASSVASNSPPMRDRPKRLNSREIDESEDATTSPEQSPEGSPERRVSRGDNSGDRRNVEVAGGHKGGSGGNRVGSAKSKVNALVWDKKEEEQDAESSVIAMDPGVSVTPMTPSRPNSHQASHQHGNANQQNHQHSGHSQHQSSASSNPSSAHNSVRLVQPHQGRPLRQLPSDPFHKPPPSAMPSSPGTGLTLGGSTTVVVHEQPPPSLTVYF